MLLRTLFALVLFGALADTLLHAVQAMAQTALRRQASIAVRAEIETATALARDAVAAAVAAGGDTRRLDPEPPPAKAVCRLRRNGGCALEARAIVRFSLPVTASPCPQLSCTVYEQNNDAVGEGRIDATIEAEAVAPDGATLAFRTVRAVFRTLRVAPFAALAGDSDASALSAPLPGDDAGAAPRGTAPGTLVDVLYRNAVTGETFPANVWQATAESANGATAWRP